MSNNPYSRYSYKRKPRRRSIFPIVSVIALLIVVLLIANLLIGFIDFGNGSSPGTVTLRGANVWALESGSFSTKSEAAEHAYQVKENGGAGFVIAIDSDWIVLENGYVTKENAVREQKDFQVREFSLPERKITLKDKKHKKTFVAVTDSFITNFELFNEYLYKIRAGEATAAEISSAALEKYNDLQAAVKQLYMIQENAGDSFYAKVLLAANKQLLALYLLSGSASDKNYQSAVSICVCSTIFAYIDLISL